MGRFVVLGTGVVIGALGLRRLTRPARGAGHDGQHAQATSWTDQVRDFADAVREGMAEREGELRAALGVAGDPIEAGQARELLERPTAPRH